MGSVGIHLDRRTGRPLVLHKTHSPGVEDDEPIYSIESMKSLLDGIWAGIIPVSLQAIHKAASSGYTARPERRVSEFRLPAPQTAQAAGNVCHTIGVFV